MFLGNINIKEQFLGDTPIKSIWLGTTQVWSGEYTYEISNVALKYSSGDMLLCNGSNYAYISCTLKTYDRTGTVVKTRTDMKMNIGCDYASLAEYMDIDGINRIWFNLDKYGTTDMSYFSSNLTIPLKPSINDLTGSTLNIIIEKNVPVSAKYSGQINNAECGIYKVIPSYVTSISINLNCYERTTTTYKSGKTGWEDEVCSASVINENTKTVVGTSTYSVSAPITANSNPYPILHCFRISEDADVTQYLQNDYYLYLMQRSNVNRSNKLALFHNSTEVYEDYYIEQSTDVILMNDAHKDGYSYSMTSDSQTLTFYEKNGVLFIEGVTSSTDNWVTIEVEYEEGKFEEITFNILGN